MLIRKTVPADLPQILAVYAYAREQMKQNGNPSQWGDDRPSLAVLEEDVRKGQSYVIEEKNQICGVFTFVIGSDPTYQVIEQGRWLNEMPYGNIHRIAVKGSVKHIYIRFMSYCIDRIPNIRIDTHADNLIMQHLLVKNGFQKCGIIYVDDGSPRIAYQRCH